MAASQSIATGKLARAAVCGKKLRILFLIKALGAGPGGGAERILCVICNALAARGHEVAAMTFDAPGQEDFYTLDANIKRVRLGLGPTLQRSGVVTTARRVIAIRRAVQDLRPDIAIGFMHSAFVPLAFALPGTGIPIVGSERTSYHHYRTRPVQRILLRASVTLIDLFTANGEEIRAGFPPAIAGKMVVLPNPVIEAERLADVAGGDVKTLLSVGGLREEKDHRTLIFAFASLADKFPGWRLRIVGEGPLRDELGRQINESGLADRIDLAGASTAVGIEYANAQLFALPSRYEAFPNTIAEALAHGLPAVGFAECPGTNVLIVPRVNGDLASGPDRIQALSECLAPLMASAPLRQELARNAPSITNLYSITAAIDRWEETLLSAVRGSR